MNVGNKVKIKIDSLSEQSLTVIRKGNIDLEKVYTVSSIEGIYDNQIMLEGVYGLYFDDSILEIVNDGD